MKASEHIEKLQKMIDEHGDHEIYYCSEEYEGPVDLKVEFISEMSDDMIWEDDEPDPPVLIEQYIIGANV